MSKHLIYVDTKNEKKKKFVRIYSKGKSKNNFFLSFILKYINR